MAVAFLSVSAISAVLFLFGVALMFGKCGFVIDGINHATNAWDGYITEKGHFILKGLQVIGIALGIQLIIINYYLDLYWLRYLAIGIILVSAMLVYYLEGKLYVNQNGNINSTIPASAGKERNYNSVKQVQSVFGLIIGVFLVFLFIYGIPIVGRIFEINLPDEGFLEELLYTVLRGCFVIGVICYTIHLGINKHLLNTIDKTDDPDQKIRLIDKAIKRKCPNPLAKTGKSREITCATKIGFLLKSANAYISKEDYRSALNRLTEARTMFEYLGEDQVVSYGLGIHEQCILAESVCLSHLGLYDEAAKLLAPFMNRLETMDDVGVSLAMLARFEYAICVNDSQTARKVIIYIQPIFKRLEKKFGSDIKSDYFLMDGIVNMLEGMYEEGTRKLQYVINNTKNYGNLRRAKKLMNYV